VASKQT